MQILLFLERLFYFWIATTAMGLLIVVLYWAISTIVYIAFISLFISILAAAFYHFYWANRNN